MRFWLLLLIILLAIPIMLISCSKLDTSVGSYVPIFSSATADNPIMNANNLKMKLDMENPVKVSFYNINSSSCETFGASLFIECIDESSKESIILEQKTVPIVVPIGASRDLGAIVTPSGLESRTYPCTIQVICDDVNLVPVNSVYTFIFIIE